MKRKLSSKKTPTRQPKTQDSTKRLKPNANRDLPPNEKVNKYADEIYGDTEIPSR